MSSSGEIVFYLFFSAQFSVRLLKLMLTCIDCKRLAKIKIYWLYSVTNIDTLKQFKILQALRSIEKHLQLEKLYVLGTHCVDNSPSLDATRKFYKAASQDPDTITGYEFMQGIDI